MSTHSAQRISTDQRHGNTEGQLDETMSLQRLLTHLSIDQQKTAAYLINHYVMGAESGKLEPQFSE